MFDPTSQSDMEDGCFYICFEDFCKYFDSIDFVHINLNAFFDQDSLSAIDMKWF
jgi:hypothetical protein